MHKVNFIEVKEVKKNDFIEPIDKNQFGFNMYMTAAFIGLPKSGKTLAAINLARYLQDNNLITEIFVLSSTLDNNPFDVLNIDDDHLIDDDDHLIEHVKDIIKYCKSKVNIWKNIREEYTEQQYNRIYNDIYKIYVKNKKRDIIDIEDELILNDEDIEILEDNKYQKKPTYYKYGPSFLIIMDDINGTSATSRSESNPLIRLISNHRHNHINLFILTQNFLSSIPPKVRRQVKIYIIFKLNDEKEIIGIHNEVVKNYIYDYEEFLKLYREITDEPHTFMLIDNDPKNPTLKIRKNFNYIA